MRLRTWGTALAAAGCLAVLPVTLTRATGGRQGPPLPLLAAAAPFAVPALVLVLTLALLGRWRAAAVLPGALLALHLAWLAPSLTPDGDAPDAGGTGLTVMTANLYRGQADAGAVVAAVEAARVDVLATVELTPQEVDRLGAAGLRRLLPYALLVPESGASGAGIWSRLPLTPLPRVGGTSFPTPRAAVTLPGGGTVSVTAVHPYAPIDGPTVASWRSDLAALRGATGSTSGPQVVLGDFNATRDHAPFRALLDGDGLRDGTLRDAADAVGLPAWPGVTWPADRRYPPLLRLDHVLASASVGVRSVEVVPLPGSDHRAVVAVLHPPAVTTSGGPP